MRRIIYLFYYLKRLDIRVFKSFLRHAVRTSGHRAPAILWDMVTSSLIYNISLLEYFQFGFPALTRTERKTYAGTGFMYEYQLKMNPRKTRVILDDKTRFYRSYSNFIKRPVADVASLRVDPGLVDKLLNHPSGKIVFKVFNGKCGEQVLIRDCADFRGKDPVDFMVEHNYDLAEAFITQHPVMNALSPSAVNTVRIITQLNSTDEVEILGCRLRISVNSTVDNMAAGNLAAPVNEVSGVVEGPGVYSDITKAPENVHPVTGTSIAGFQIPFWQETMEMAKEAAKIHTRNRSIGWDIAITGTGPELIEGNHDWCKLVWQLPVNRGLKPVLERYLSM